MIMADIDGSDLDPGLIMELGGVRTALVVPMFKENELIGSFALYRQEPRPFSDKQIELVKNFAAEAVIAIENARLLNELRQSLEQQTATAEVLQVVSSSLGDLEPVFAMMLEKAVRICDAKFGNLWLREGVNFRIGATHGSPAEWSDFLRREPLFQVDPRFGLGCLVLTKQTYQVADVAAEPTYEDKLRVATIELAHARSLIGVPLLRDGEVIGAFAIYRQEVRPFTDRQIQVVENFAAQAVIAIENARLLNELRERTDQLAVQSQELAELNQQLEQRVTDQVGEIERMSRLRRFLPPQVADLIVASGSEKQLESHRREITALFCDLRGFTGFTKSADRNTSGLCCRRDLR